MDQLQANGRRVEVNGPSTVAATAWPLRAHLLVHHLRGSPWDVMVSEKQRVHQLRQSGLVTVADRHQLKHELDLRRAAVAGLVSPDKGVIGVEIKCSARRSEQLRD